ncbi:MAG TPA: PIG-L family deacetylase [Candidatus Levybacteria bacterium]|nr:PIG-L family deacetylase [Candidatus Levybacteria bacterium]
MEHISGKTIVAVFAHPDDETFGPGGTLHKLTKNNTVYTICATDGSAGENNSGDQTHPVADIRHNELKNASQVLGVNDVFFLGFKDGSLNNNQYHEIADAVRIKLEELQPDIVITFEPQGVSGHIDHITMSMISSYVVRKIPSVQELWYYGNLKERAETRKDYFIYFPPGYAKSEFDIVVDINDVWDVKVTAMHEHKSQVKDMENILKTAEKFPKEEYFFVVKKEDL